MNNDLLLSSINFQLISNNYSIWKVFAVQGFLHLSSESGKRAILHVFSTAGIPGFNPAAAEDRLSYKYSNS